MQRGQVPCLDTLDRMDTLHGDLWRWQSEERESLRGNACSGKSLLPGTWRRAEAVQHERLSHLDGVDRVGAVHSQLWRRSDHSEKRVCSPEVGGWRAWM